MKTIQLQAVIEGIRARKDRSLGVSFTTPELTAEEKAMIFELQNQNVEMTIKPTDAEQLEDHVVDADLNQKTQSQRIRSVLFVIWKQNPEGKEFTDYYKEKTEKYIDYLKGKIE